MKKTVAVMVVLLQPHVLRADGGLLRLVAQEAEYRISVFTAPTPVRAGPIDISVLVQDTLTGAPLPATRIEVRFCKSGLLEVTQLLSSAAATNKLLQAAEICLPEAGDWYVDVAVDGVNGQAHLSFVIDVSEPLPRWLDLWPWFSWPAAVVAVYCFRRRRPSVASW